MSQKYSIELEALAKDAIKQVGELNAKVDDLTKGTAAAGKETKKTNKILGGLKNLVSGGLGLGIIIKLFDVLKETFMANQKVADIFATGMETISLVFNQVVEAVIKGNGEFNALGKVLKNVLNIGLAPFKLAFEGISIAIMSAQKAFLTFTGGSQEKIQELTLGIIEAKAEVVAIGEGVIDSGKAIVDNFGAAVNSIKDISISAAYETAQANIELKKSAELAQVVNQGLIEKYDRQAEQQRQIRDDETKTIEERVKANKELGRILEEQQEKMLENVDLTIKSAQAQYDKNKSQENLIALLTAQNEREGVLAQIEGFRSEQLINTNSLERERIDLIKEKDELEQERSDRIKELTTFEEESAYAALERDKEIALEELALLEGTEAEKQKILDHYAGEKQKLLDQDAADEKQLGEDVLNAKMDQAQAGLSLITDIAGEGSKIGKAAAIAQATISGVQGVQNAFTTASASPIAVAFPPYPFIQAGLAGAFALKSIQSIASAKKPSASASGGGSAPSAPQAPSFNVVGAAPENQLAQAIGNKEDKPLKAFVVSNEITNQQALDRNITEGASIG